MAHSGLYNRRHHVNDQSDAEAEKGCGRIAECIYLRVEVPLQALKRCFDCPSFSIEVGNGLGVGATLRDICYDVQVLVTIPRRFVQKNEGRSKVIKFS